jgi:serine/threonine protein kinase
MDSETVSRLSWQKTKEEFFTYNVMDVPEDNVVLYDNIEWKDGEWLNDYDAYPDGGGVRSADSARLRFVLKQYGIPPDILPLESVRYTSPEQLHSLQEQLSALGGANRLRDVLSKIEHSGYRMKGYLGAGGWGVVFHMIRATDDSEVAVKILKPPYNQEWRKRFLREVAVLNLLADDYSLGGLNGDPFDVEGLMCLPLRFISGRALSDLALPVNTRDALEIVCEVLSILHIVHERGVIHRDLHLGNVMLESNTVLVIVDFGVARQEQVTDYTHTFRPVGAMSHCAPEKWTNPSKVDAASDVFSVGVMLYRLLTDKFPFWAETYIRLYEQIRDGKFTDVSEANPEVLPFIDIVVKALLEPNPQERPATAKEALAVLGHAKALVDLVERQKSRGSAPQQPARRGRR